jgi:hypothetical protein
MEAFAEAKSAPEPASYPAPEAQKTKINMDENTS